MDNRTQQAASEPTARELLTDRAIRTPGETAGNGGRERSADPPHPAAADASVDAARRNLSPGALSPAAAAELAADSAQPWTTLAQLAGDPAVAAQAAREFKNDPRPAVGPAAPAPLFPIVGQDAAPAAPGKAAGNGAAQGVDRRKFLQWSTAAMALVSAG
ncbi:MAG: hypothetical protein ACRD13_14590 [Terriglobales bacterium]